MAEREFDNHPDLELLAAHAAGQSAENESAAIQRHLEDCPFCRLELKRLKRFANIDADEELLEDAGWRRAEFALARSFREKILPAVTGERSPTRPQRRSTVALRWLVPAAAAAAVIFILVNRDLGPGQPIGRHDPLRGIETAGQEIVPETPLGELSRCPDLFSWRTTKQFDSFTLEIFTPDLATLYRQELIPTQKLAVPDSLRSLLAEGKTYLWSVHGYVGLEPDVLSANGWFKILPE